MKLEIVIFVGSNYCSTLLPANGFAVEYNMIKHRTISEIYLPNFRLPEIQLCLFSKTKNTEIIAPHV